MKTYEGGRNMKYENPELEVIKFIASNVITTSQPIVEDGEEDSVGWG